MNISFNWLKDLIDMDLRADELARRLTDAGIAVDAVHPAGHDYVLDIDLTSNRPDCLSHLGVARETSVITGRPLLIVDHVGQVVPVPAPLAGNIVQVDAADLCHRFTARIITDVKIGPSPQWMVERLEAIGERSINNVADITNYVMHELGQPMHSFDLDKLGGRRIVVRRAHPGETIVTLDEVERKLDGDMLAICDAERPVAVAGIMGGMHSGITEGTTNVLLEVAYFKRENIRATSRKLNLASEASYRFERGVDVDNLLRASARATDLICELAGGTAGDLVDSYPEIQPKSEVRSNDISHAVRRLTGLEVSAEECQRILSALGVSKKDAVETGETIYISPSWRHDLSIEEDLVEEVARHIGYDAIRSEIPPAYEAGEYQENEPRKLRLRQMLADMGFDEAVSYSFISTELDDVFEPVPGVVDENAAEPFVTLKDSVIEGAVRMRPSVLPGLLTAVRHNFNQQRRDLKLFEIGRAFAGEADPDALPNEQEVLAVVLTGDNILEGRASGSQELAFFDLKGAFEAAADAAGLPELGFAEARVKHLRPGQTAAVSLHSSVIGYIGRLADEIAARFKFRQPVYVGEINLQQALLAPPISVVYRPLPRFPAIVRDVSVIAKRSLSYRQIKDAIIEQGFELLRHVSFVDVYEGKGMASDERSVTMRLEYRSDERTLTEDEVEAVHHKIVSSIEDAFGVQQRT